MMCRDNGEKNILMENKTKKFMKKLLLAVSLFCLFIQPKHVHAVRSQTIDIIPEILCLLGGIWAVTHCTTGKHGQGPLDKPDNAIIVMLLLGSSALTHFIGHSLFTTPEDRRDNAIALLDAVETNLSILAMFDVSASNKTINDDVVSVLCARTTEIFVMLATIEQWQKPVEKVFALLAAAKKEMYDVPDFCSVCNAIEARASIILQKLFKLSAVLKARAILSAAKASASLAAPITV